MFGQRLLDGRPLTVYGDGLQTRDYVYVGDVADAFFAVATNPLPTAGSLERRAFNIGTAVETSVNDLVRVLAHVTGKKPIVQYAPARPGEIARSVLDPSKAQRQLNWSARVSLDEGLRQTYEWLADHA
jgi:UDP-glucose 4-epimerase